MSQTSILTITNYKGTIIIPTQQMGKLAKVTSLPCEPRAHTLTSAYSQVALPQSFHLSQVLCKYWVHLSGSKTKNILFPSSLEALRLLERKHKYTSLI